MGAADLKTDLASDHGEHACIELRCDGEPVQPVTVPTFMRPTDSVSS
jgi:hypothetical protein